MFIVLQIMLTKGMDLCRIIPKIDEEMDQVSGDAFFAMEARMHLAAGDVSPNKRGIVLVAGFRDEDGMGMKMTLEKAT